MALACAAHTPAAIGHTDIGSRGISAWECQTTNSRRTCSDGFSLFWNTFSSLFGMWLNSPIWQCLDCGLVDEALATTYKSVKDFKWHRAQASPNWGLLEDKVAALAGGKFDDKGRTAAHYQVRHKGPLSALWLPCACERTPPEGYFSSSSQSDVGCSFFFAILLQSLSLWRPPSVAENIGLMNALAPPPPPNSTEMGSASTSVQMAAGGNEEDDDEDEL